jgi:hypothetical protein
MKWEDLLINDILNNLNTNLNGLSDEKTQKRILKYGYNELIEKKKFGALYCWERSNGFSIVKATTIAFSVCHVSNIQLL